MAGFGCRLLQHIVPALQVMVQIARESAHISVIALYRSSCYWSVDQECCIKMDAAVLIYWLKTFPFTEEV